MYTMTLEKNEPNALKSHSEDEVNRVVAPLEWREEPEPVMATSEKVKMHPAADSGSVDHCTHPKDLPKSVRVIPPDRPRGFVGAKGDDIDHYGSAEVTLEQTDGQEINCTMQLADVCRPLHSVSKIADNAGDMLFKKNCAYVVPEGVFDEILAVVRHLAKYPRKGGLYVAEMHAKNPDDAKKTQARAPPTVSRDSGPPSSNGNVRPSGFARPDAAR